MGSGTSPFFSSFWLINSLVSGVLQKAHTVNYITSKAFNTKMNAEYTNMLGEELSKHDSSIDALDLIISKHRKKELRNLDNRITCALEYFCLLLKGLKIEESVVFVAMPFSKEYLEYYKTYYRPVLTKSGYDCIRAWGGLGHENYSEYMRILISRCGKMFADISGKNENVMYEVGVAHGQDKHVYLVTNDKDYPSNLCDDVVMYYDPSLPYWESSATDNFQMWFLAEQVGSGMRDQFVAKLNKIRDM